MEILLFILLLLVPCSILAASDPLSLALFTLKSQLVDPSHSLKDWSLPSPSVCSWTGIKCNHNSSTIIALDLSMKNLGGSLSGMQFTLFPHLVHLNLSHNSFSGHLPSGVFNLTSLASLDISRNNFSGVFPPGISTLANLVVLDAFSNSFSGPLPPDVSSLPRLRILNFAGSYFSGAIPPDYGSFKSLHFIHLAGNFLTGTIPSELGSLTTLSHMEIGYNSYQGGIPWQLGNMTRLQYLDIADANISGSIPHTLCNLTDLQSLFLFRNLLTGTIPWHLSAILPLKSLDLSDNRLSGTIPDSFSELKNLRLLSLMYNDFTGSVPEAIANLPQLHTLLIWNNFFTGSLPRDLGRSSKLQHLDASTNYLVGSIPPHICFGGQLQKLILFSNNFSGGLSPSLSNCSSLVRLRLEDNSFSGDISLQFGSLSYVDLSRNRFTGGIPSDIALASGLEYLNVSYNVELGGVMPIKIWSLSALRNFSMVCCGVSSHIPAFEGCKSVGVVELRMNNLSGKIPESVCNCKNLVAMDLGSNKLTGPIPRQLAHLQLFNVSYNDLWGSIPWNKAFKRSWFLGNPRLCGAPLRGCSGGHKVAWVVLVCGVTVLLMVLGILVLHLKISRGHWRTVAFNGVPQFRAKDVLTSGKVVVLPGGISVSAKKMEWQGEGMLQLLARVGNVRHDNLTRLVGVCYNHNLAYLLNDYMPNGNLADKMAMGMGSDWETKCRIVTGVAKGLCFLHHHCFPPIPHGNLNPTNVLFDLNMEPHLAHYGLTHTPGTSIRDHLDMDVYNFGALLLEVFTNGRVSQITHTQDLLRRVAHENRAALHQDVKSVVEVAMMCAASRPSERPSMQHALNLLLKVNSRTKQ